MSTITINEKEYQQEDLTDAAQQQIANIQSVDAEISRLNSQAAMFQTARNTYFNTLLAEVEAKAEAKPAAKKRS